MSTHIVVSEFWVKTSGGLLRTGNEYSSSIKEKKFLDQDSNYLVLKKGSAT
jgi:hypothetical protein